MNTLTVLLWHLQLCLHAVADNTVHSPPKFDQAIDDNAYGHYPTRTYSTLDDANSPQTNFVQWDNKCADGRLYFLTPRGWIIDNPGPVLLDQYGELVWAKHFDNEFGGQAYNFMVQQYRGDDYLTFWLGDDRVRGHGSGSYYMLNSSYDIVHKVDAANNQAADLHEFLITPEGTALMTIYEIVSHDVTEFRSFDPENPDDRDPNHIWDCLLQEVDIATGNLVFEWRASDHLAINNTYHGIGGGGTKNDPFDWFHINSIEKDELGNYLVSARYTQSIIYVDGKTGDIIWTLGGRQNDFMDLSDGFGLNFAWQHDARFRPTNTFPNTYNPPSEQAGFTTRLMTFFDNTAEDQHYEYGLEHARALVLEITYPTPGSEAMKDSRSRHHPTFRVVDEGLDLNQAKVQETNGTNPDFTVRVIKSFENPSGLRSSSQGSVQILPQDGIDPKVLVGFGLNAVFTEYDSNGNVLCDVHYGSRDSWEGGDIQSYRVLKFPWVGQPRTAPSIDISDDDAEVYVSWNGATEVSDWILQCSQLNTDDEKSWADIVRISKNGFETAIPLEEATVSEAPFLRVIAVDRNGRRLNYGISETLDRTLIPTYFPLVGEQKVMSLDPFRTIITLVSVVGLCLVLYELYRRYLSWRSKPGRGPVRWRERGRYRLLSDAS